MMIAIPVSGEKLSAHFGRCESFALIEVDDESRQVKSMNWIQAPPHQPGLLPQWLRERGVTAVIAGGMGPRAQQLLAQLGIHAVIGAPEVAPEQLVADYLAGQLKTSQNPCDH